MMMEFGFCMYLLEGWVGEGQREGEGEGQRGEGGGGGDY